MFDYETLRIIWWLILGTLLIGFAVMDGFDLGVAMLLPFVAKNDLERRITINTIGPVWEGNQVWFVLGGGAIFAAWPFVYAVSFSGFYIAMFLILSALILRPVGFKFRSKIRDPRWSSFWDWALFIAGFVPALVFGIAIGNTLQGVPFQFDTDLYMSYQGSFFGLLNPFGLLCGLVSVSMLILHGGLYLAVKTEATIRDRSIKTARFFGIITIVLFAAAGYWLTFLDGYTIVGQLAHDGPSNPLHKEVAKTAGAWLSNYQTYPLTKIAPLLGFAGVLLAVVSARFGNSKVAFAASAIGIIGIISTVGLSMFPFILPSSSHPNNSLLIWDASSSVTTLKNMLIATGIFLPIILSYTAWVFRVLQGKVTAADITNNDHDMY